MLQAHRWLRGTTNGIRESDRLTRSREVRQDAGISCDSKTGRMIVGAVVLVLSAAVLVLLLERSLMAEPTFDHERLVVYRFSMGVRHVRLAYRESPIRYPSTGLRTTGYALLHHIP